MSSSYIQNTKYEASLSFHTDLLLSMFEDMLCSSEDIYQSLCTLHINMIFLEKNIIWPCTVKSLNGDISTFPVFTELLYCWLRFLKIVPLKVAAYWNNSLTLVLICFLNFVLLKEILVQSFGNFSLWFWRLYDWKNCCSYFLTFGQLLGCVTVATTYCFYKWEQMIGIKNSNNVWITTPNPGGFEKGVSRMMVDVQSNLPASSTDHNGQGSYLNANLSF